MKTLPFINAKHILLYGVLLFISQVILAQPGYLYVDSTARLVTKKDYIYIPDNLIVHDNGVVHNEDSIFLKGDLDNGIGPLFESSSNYFVANKDTLRPRVGNVVFSGNNQQKVKSKNTNIAFSQISIDNQKYNLILDTSVYVFGKIQMRANNLNLAGNNIHTFIVGAKKLNSGEIGKEGPYQIMDDTYRENDPDIAKGKGYVKGFAEDEELEDNYKTLGISFSDPYNFYIDRGHIQLNNAGDGSIKKFFRIRREDPSFDGNITITYLDPLDFQGLGISEPSFRLFLKQNPVNTSQTNSQVEYRNWGGTLNVENNTVTITPTENVPDTALFTIADKDCKNPPKIYLGPALINVCQEAPYSIEDTETESSNVGFDYRQWYVDGEFQPLMQTNLFNDLRTTCDTIIYKLVKIDNRGCEASDSVKVIVRPKPEAFFKKERSFYCKNQTFTLLDTSRIADKSALTSYWAFGDGNTSSLKEVTYSYASTGEFQLFHKVTSIYDCSETISIILPIKDIPNVSFIFDRACNSKEVTFYNQSTIGNGEKFSSALWEFETGSSITLSDNSKTPMKDTLKYTYTSAGLKTIKLTMMGSGGCSDSISKEIVIDTDNTLLFSAEDACAESPVDIQNTSTIGSTAPSWYWDFGDGSFSTQQEPAKTYKNPGRYDIKMKIRTASCADSLTKSIEIYDYPKASFTVENACANKDVSFILENAYTPSYSYTWNINGTTYNTAEPVLKFANSGSFNALLTVATDKGCKVEVNKKFSVYASPKPNFTYQKVCFGNATPFYNQSTIQSGSATYRWSFTDEDGSINTNPSYKYTDTAGIRPVKLVVISNNGCADSITQQVEVYPLPHKGLEGSLPVCGSSYAIDATVNDPRYTVASYTWSNGVKSPVNVVTSSNTYSVTMRTSDGCSATESIAISFGSSLNINLPATQTFCGTGALDAGYSSQYCTWNTGENERILNIDKSGTYSVTVQMSDCKATATTNVTVNSNPVVELGEDINTCSGEKVTLNAGTGTATYIWSNAAITPTIDVTNSGLYKVTVTSAEGCQVTDRINVSFRPSPLKTLPKETNTCKEALLDAGNRGATYEWSNFATTRTTLANTSDMYWVKITNADNCSITDSTRVTILPSANISLGPDVFICEGNSVTLNAGNQGSEYSYRWNGEASQSFTYIARKSGQVIAEAINANSGCVSADTMVIFYKLSPRINLGNDRMICSSDNITLDAGNPGSLVQWKSTNGFSSNQQTIEVNQPGTYSVTIMNSDGCLGFDSLTVYPSAGEMVAEFIAASTVRAGDTVHFVNVSYPDPYTCSWRFGDGVRSQENSPTHIFFIRDTFNVQLTISNGYCSATSIKPVVVSGFKNKLKPGEGDSNGQFLRILSSNVFPNPTNGAFTFEILFSATTNMMVNLYDIKGQLYYVESIKNVEEYSRDYSFEKLPAGIYIFKASSGKLNVTYKIVKAAQ